MLFRNILGTFDLKYDSLSDEDERKKKMLNLQMLEAAFIRNVQNSVS